MTDEQLDNLLTSEIELVSKYESIYKKEYEYMELQSKLEDGKKIYEYVPSIIKGSIRKIDAIISNATRRLNNLIKDVSEKSVGASDSRKQKNKEYLIKAYNDNKDNLIKPLTDAKNEIEKVKENISFINKNIKRISGAKLLNEALASGSDTLVTYQKALNKAYEE